MAVNTASPVQLLSVPLEANPQDGTVYRLKAHGQYRNTSGANRTLTLQFILGNTTVMSGPSGSIATHAGSRSWVVEFNIVVIDTLQQYTFGFGSLSGPNSIWSPIPFVSQNMAFEWLNTIKNLRLVATHSLASANLEISLGGYYVEKLR